MPLTRVDSHVHFWRYTPHEYEWLDERMRELRRDFLPADLEPVLRDHDVAGVVAVQARQSLAETEWLLEISRHSRSVLGVVGWVDLRGAGVAAELARFAGSRLCGVRHVVQAEPPGFLLASEFQRGMRAVTARGLAYDLLLHAGQLEEAAALVDLHPEQRFVLDHLAKPHILTGRLEPWASDLRQLAARPNVWLKLSGLVTEADWAAWQPADLRPYLEVALEAFGTDRTMFGSDHPVCLVAASYAEVLGVVSDFIHALSESERQQVLAGNATSFYRLAAR